MYVYGRGETNYGEMQENYLQIISTVDILKCNNVKL
jgi:hypothetical protein